MYSIFPISQSYSTYLYCTGEVPIVAVKFFAKFLHQPNLLEQQKVTQQSTERSVLSNFSRRNGFRAVRPVTQRSTNRGPSPVGATFGNIHKTRSWNLKTFSATFLAATVLEQSDGNATINRPQSKPCWSRNRKHS